MTYRDDLRLEFNAWFKQNFPNETAFTQEMLWKAYLEGSSRGFNDGMSFGAEMEGGGR